MALLGLFIALQASRREPLMRLGIFRARNLAASNLVMLLLGAAWIPTWFFLNLYLQQVLGLGAFDGGAALLPMTLTVMVLVVVAAPRVIARVRVARRTREPVVEQVCAGSVKDGIEPLRTRLIPVASALPAL